MMDTPRSQRAKSARKSAGAEGKEASGAPAESVRIFDDLDLAAYIEEFLSVKVDEIGTNLERTIGDRLLDLVETHQKLAERLEGVRQQLATHASTPVVAPPAAIDEGALHELRVRADSLTEQLKLLEERGRALQDEIYQLRDERSTLKNTLAALQTQEEGQRERDLRLRAEIKQAQSDLVGVRAELASLTRQLQEARQKEEAARIEASRAREDLAALRAEQSLLRKDDENRRGSVTQLREEIDGMRAAEARLRDEVTQLRTLEGALRDEVAQMRGAESRLRDENTRLQSELGRVHGREHAMKVQGEEIQRLQDVISALQQDLSEARTRPSTPSSEHNRDGERLQALQRDLARLEAENDTLRSRRSEAEQRAMQAGTSSDEAQRIVQTLREQVRTLSEQIEGQRHEITELGAQLSTTRGERDRIAALSKDATTKLAEIENDARRRIEAAETLQRETAEKAETLERTLRGEIEMLTAKKNALTETLRAYSDPEKFRDIKLREMHQEIETLNATMREKDNLLQESGKDQVVLGQEVEKVRKEKYESQVMYERRIKELQESLQRETREKEKERQERHLLEEQLAKAKKKSWFG